LGEVDEKKYCKGLMVENWIRIEYKSLIGVSNVWKCVVRSFLVLGRWVAYKIGKGNRLIIEDPWVGISGNLHLS
jgi:hypothetical protein